MKISSRFFLTLAIAAAASPSLPLPAGDTGTPSPESLSAADTKRPYSPYAGGAVPNKVFWGDTHLHYYDYDLIDGIEHITMGPAGASFHHEGPGNVDHLMWVTMTEEGPEIGNIALKGIFDRKGLAPDLFGAYDRKGAGEEDGKEEEPKKKEEK